MQDNIKDDDGFRELIKSRINRIRSEEIILRKFHSTNPFSPFQQTIFCQIRPFEQDYLSVKPENQALRGEFRKELIYLNYF